MSAEYGMTIRQVTMPDGVWYVASVPTLSVSVQARTAADALVDLAETFRIMSEHGQRSARFVPFGYLIRTEDAEAAREFWTPLVETCEEDTDAG